MPASVSTAGGPAKVYRGVFLFGLRDASAGVTGECVGDRAEACHQVPLIGFTPIGFTRLGVTPPFASLRVPLSAGVTSAGVRSGCVMRSAPGAR